MPKEQGKNVINWFEKFDLESADKEEIVIDSNFIPVEINWEIL